MFEAIGKVKVRGEGGRGVFVAAVGDVIEFEDDRAAEGELNGEFADEGDMG